MSLFHQHQFDSMSDLFVGQLRDLYDAERRQCDAGAKMADRADARELAAMFRQQNSEAHQQLARLESAFSELGLDPKSESCEVMKGLIKETEDVVSAAGEAWVRDAALIAAAQRIKHYEIAGYGTARTFAEELGHFEIATLLQQSLDEEARADERFTDLATQRINPRAADGEFPARGHTFDSPSQSYRSEPPGHGPENA
jgi:ferritin-like metal-binding protein YciE